MLSRSQLPLAVGAADVMAHMAFHSAASYFHSGTLDRRWWRNVKTLAKVDEPLCLSKRSFVVIDGNVSADITASDGAAIIVYGDISAQVQMGGHAELIVAGSIAKGGRVSADGIFHLFVGGDIDGCLRSQGSCKAWVEGCTRGEVWTGYPSTELRVLGDCTATIRPVAEAALLYLAVDGFMDYASLEATARFDYTLFNASVGRSDRPAGIYPEQPYRKKVTGGGSHNRWIIGGTGGRAETP